MKFIILGDDIRFMKEFKQYIADFMELQGYSDVQILCIYDVLKIVDIDDAVCYFIDTEIGSVNGIQVSERIHAVHPHALIIFISSNEQSVFDCFSVAPFTFLLKSAYKERMEFEKSRFLKQLSLISQVYQGDFRIYNEYVFMPLVLYQRNIMYVEKENANCVLHYHDKKIIQHINLKDVKLKLCGDFFQINKAQILNLNYIQAAHEGKIKLINDAVFYVSRRRKHEFIEYYLAFLGNR